MLSRLLLEKIKLFSFQHMMNPKQMWRVRFKSTASGKELVHMTETFEQAQRFRSAFNLGGDPSTAPERVME